MRLFKQDNNVLKKRTVKEKINQSLCKNVEFLYNWKHSNKNKSKAKMVKKKKKPTKRIW